MQLTLKVAKTQDDAFRQRKKKGNEECEKVNMCLGVDRLGGRWWKQDQHTTCTRMHFHGSTVCFWTWGLRFGSHGNDYGPDRDCLVACQFDGMRKDA